MGSRTIASENEPQFGSWVINGVANLKSLSVTSCTSNNGIIDSSLLSNAHFLRAHVARLHLIRFPFDTLIPLAPATAVKSHRIRALMIVLKHNTRPQIGRK